MRDLKNWGFEHSVVYIDGKKYLDRKIVYVAGYTIRLHTFYRGDDARASHDHPWPFWTFPLHGYTEDVFEKGRWLRSQRVEALRWHYRPRGFEHTVVGLDAFPARTIVITGRRHQTWGFYPEPGKFVPWWEWK